MTGVSKSRKLLKVLMLKERKRKMPAQLKNFSTGNRE
jgi:hypothetical protein